VREAERLVELDDHLTQFLAGAWRPADTSQRIELAQFALVHNHAPLIAAPLYRDALSEDQSLVTDPRTGHRYNAACAALLATTQTDETAATLSGSDCIAWRTQALDWLRADLAAWRQLADSTPDARPQVAQTLAHWREDVDLGSIRDAEPLARLPEPEQQQWRDLWDLVAQLRQSCASSSSAAAGGVTTGLAPAER
jgi:hypothetical protein